MRDDGSATSWVDHFLCSEQLVPSFSSVSLVDLPQTFLIINHLLLSLTVPLTLLPILRPCSLNSSASTSSFSASQSKLSIAWHHASPVQISAYCDLDAHLKLVIYVC